MASTDQWSKREAAALRSLDVGDVPTALEHVRALESRFGEDSARVSLLRGMVEEASGDPGKAKKTYNKVLEDNPCNQLAMKRIIAMELAVHGNKGDRSAKADAVIKSLGEYLKTHSADAEAWARLADLHLEQTSYDRAQFCLEECVLLAPFNPVYHCRLGEVVLAQENFEQARRHFAMAIKSSEGQYTRALFGLALATKDTAGTPAAGGGGAAASASSPSAELHAVALERLNTAYGDSALKGPMVESLR